MKSFLIGSPLGKLKADFFEGDLLSLGFYDGKDIALQDMTPECRELNTQLREYFDRSRFAFDIPMNPRGTDFQKRVWEMLQDIEFNSTCSYWYLAERYGDIRAIRAIASANGANPIAILIPCHRVIGSDGSLTGYAGGLWRKEYLLDLERGVQRIFD